MPTAATLLALAALVPAQDPIRVEATLSASRVEVGENVVLEISVETGGASPESIELPPLPDALQVVGTRDYSHFQFRFPGGRSRVVRREVVLRARAPGRFEIEPVAVEVDGGFYRTRALSLLVTGSVARGGPSPGPAGVRARGPGDEVVLLASLAPDTVYVGEQVTLRADAMFAEDVRVRLRRSPEYRPPDAAGFWVHDLPDVPLLEPRVVGGRVYEVQTFRRAYFPLAAGRYTFPPARLFYDVRRGYLLTPEAHELASDSLPLVVRPLPEAGRPAAFTGAVGRYRVRSRLEPTEVPAGEAAVLTLEVEGEGNVKGLPPPAVPEVDGVQVYPPTEESEVDVVEGRVRGVKRFAWVVVPEAPGRVDLPPLEYAFFDPERAEYDVARAEPLALRVLPDAGTAAAAREERPATIRPLERRPAGDALGWVRSPAFGALQLAPLLGLALALGRRRGRARARTRPPSPRSLRRRRRQALAELAPLAESADPAFFGRFADVVRRWLAERLAAPGLRLAPPGELGRVLEDHGVGQGTARGIADLVARAEHARYEPSPPGRAARQALLADAGRLLDAVDRQAGRPGRNRTAAGAGTLALLLLGASAGRAAPPQTAFETGVALYEQGDYAAASGAFLEFVQASPRDAHGWYNLGNAYYRTGDTGRAVWAWLRAARLAPRDGGVRHNLSVAGAPAELVRRVTPAVPLSADEVLLLAGLAWLAGATALAAYTLGRRRGTAPAAAAGILLALALAGGWAVPRLRAATGIILDAETPLLGAPTLRAEDIGRLDPGTAVTVVGREEGWLRVSTRDGAEGWVESGRVGLL